MSDAHHFHWVDYVVFLLTITISMGIGVFFAFTGSRQDTTGEFLMGNRKMKLIPVVISLIVSYTSAIALLGSPAEIFLYGTQFMFYVIAAILGCFYGAILFVPLFYPLKLTSVFEYFEMRYESKIAKWYASIVSLFNTNLFNGIILYAPAVAFEGVTGFPSWATLLICGVSTTIYTSIGGMKAVIWTDVFQATVILVGLIAILVVGTIEVGGLAKVWRLNNEWGRIKFFDFDPDPTKRLTFWTVVFMNSILWMCITVAQPSVQRYCALPTMQQARMSIILNIPGFVLAGLMTCFAGVVAFAYYADKGCDPISSKAITNPNQILPFFVMEVLNYPGLPGLYVACLFSASLSSVSSTINAAVAITWQDFLQPFFTEYNEKQKANVNKIVSVVYGAMAIATGFLVGKMGGTLVQIAYSILGATGGPIVGMFFLASTYPSAGPVGCLIGALIGLVFSLWLNIGATFNQSYEPPLPLPNHNCFLSADNGTSIWTNTTYSNFTLESSIPPDLVSNITEAIQERSGLHTMYAISYMWYPSFGILAVMIVGIFTSCLPGCKQKKKVPKKLILPAVLYCCGRWLKNSVDYSEEPDNAVPVHDILNGDTINNNYMENFPLTSNKEKEVVVQRLSQV